MRRKRERRKNRLFHNVITCYQALRRRQRLLDGGGEQPFERKWTTLKQRTENGVLEEKGEKGGRGVHRVRDTTLPGSSHLQQPVPYLIDIPWKMANLHRVLKRNLPI